MLEKKHTQDIENLVLKLQECEADRDYQNRERKRLHEVCLELMADI